MSACPPSDLRQTSALDALGHSPGVWQALWGLSLGAIEKGRGSAAGQEGVCGVQVPAH